MSNNYSRPYTRKYPISSRWVISLYFIC